MKIENGKWKIVKFAPLTDKLPLQMEVSEGCAVFLMENGKWKMENKASSLLMERGISVINKPKEGPFGPSFGLLILIQTLIKW